MVMMMSTRNSPSALVVGAGLSGALAALHLVRSGFRVTVVRSLRRSVDADSCVWFTARFLAALREIGVQVNDLLALAVPISRMATHAPSGVCVTEPLSATGDVLCMQRSDLVPFLLEQARSAGVQLWLDWGLQTFDTDSGLVTLVTVMPPLQQRQMEPTMLVGADGGASTVRGTLIAQQAGLDFSQEHVGLRCLTLRVNPTDQGRYAWRCDAVHVFPSSAQHVLVAAPVRGGRFSAALIAPTLSRCWDSVHAASADVVITRADRRDSVASAASATTAHTDSAASVATARAIPSAASGSASTPRAPHAPMLPPRPLPGPPAPARSDPLAAAVTVAELAAADTLAAFDALFPAALPALQPTLITDVTRGTPRTLRALQCSHAVVGDRLCVALVGAAATMLLPLGAAPADLAAEDCLELGQCVLRAGGPRAVRAAVREYAQRRRAEAAAAAELSARSFWKVVRSGGMVLITPVMRARFDSVLARMVPRWLRPSFFLALDATRTYRALAAQLRTGTRLRRTLADTWMLVVALWALWHLFAPLRGAAWPRAVLQRWLARFGREVTWPRLGAVAWPLRLPGRT